MSNVATFVRIFDPEPSDDTVSKRTLTVKDIAVRYTKKSNALVDLLQAANDLTACAADQGNMPEGFANEIASLINKHSSAYVREDHELELLVCALLGALQAMPLPRPPGGLSTVDIFAAALWSGLGALDPFKEPRLEELRIVVLKRAQAYSMESAEKSRNRDTVPEIAYKLADDATGKVAAETVKDSANRAIKALRENAALDREEINILWWVLGDWSHILGSPLTKSPPLASAVIGGIELAQLLRRIPAEAHKHLLLRNVHGGKRATLIDVLDETASYRSEIAAAYASNAFLSACPFVFPLMTAVIAGESAGGGERKLATADWAARSLLENTLLNTSHMLSGV